MNMPQMLAQAPQGIAALGVAPPMQGAQQQQPDPTAPQQGGMIPDWAKLIMESQAAKLKEAAQREQAMQAQQQPTIAQQIAQKMQAQPQAPQQAQPEPQPPQGIAAAARGGMIERGGVDRLRSNLRMAHGGIVQHFEGGGLAGDLPEGFEAGDLYATAIAQAKAQPDGPRAVDLFKQMLVALKMRRPDARGSGFDDPRVKMMQDSMRDGAQADVQGQLEAPPDAPAQRKPPPTDVRSGSGRVGASMSQGVRDTGGTPAPEDDWTSTVKKGIKGLMDIDPTKQRDADAQYVRDNSGLADEATRRAEMRAKMEAAQQEMKNARPSGITQLLSNIHNAAKAERGFGKDQLATGLSAMGSGIIANNAEKEAIKAKDYAMLKELGLYDDGTAKTQLKGRAQATEAGLKGQDRARTQQTAGVGDATQFAGVLEQTKMRAQAAQQHMEVLREQIAARRQAAAQGDKSAAMQAKELIARTVGSLTTEMTALAGLIKSSPLPDPDDVARFKSLQKELDGYRGAMADASPVLKGAKPAPSTTTTRIKMDAQGNIIK